MVHRCLLTFPYVGTQCSHVTRSHRFKERHGCSIINLSTRNHQSRAWIAMWRNKIVTFFRSLCQPWMVKRLNGWISLRVGLKNLSTRVDSTGCKTFEIVRNILFTISQTTHLLSQGAMQIIDSEISRSVWLGSLSLNELRIKFGANNTIVRRAVL